MWLPHQIEAHYHKVILTFDIVHQSSKHGMVIIKTLAHETYQQIKFSLFVANLSYTKSIV